jgi:polygalacturonase
MKSSVRTLAAIVFAASFTQCTHAPDSASGASSAAAPITADAAPPANPFTPPNIPEPQFGSNKTYNVKDFGAVGDGKTNDTAAISKAIETCSDGGGGIVIVPAGKYEVASVHIQSNVCMKLDDKAVITGASTGYEPAEANEFNKYQDGGHSHFHNSVMWGENIENFAIIGGYVNGGHTIQGDKRSTGKKKKGSTTKPTTDQKQAEQDAQAKQDENEIGKDTAEASADKPATTEPIGDFGNKVICIVNGKNLLFRGVTHDTGAHFVYLLNNCENITIDHDVIRKSRDAIDLMGCRNVAVHDCHFTGCVDDTLGIKSDWALGKKILTENIYAWDDYFESGCNGLQFGSETAGDFRNVWCWNIKIGLAMKAGIGITTNDGGNIENVHYDNIEIKNAANPIFILVTDRLRSGDLNKKTGAIRNVTISNVTATDMKKGRQGPVHCATISGRPESAIENIVLTNVKMSFPGAEDAKEASITPPYPKDYSPGSMKARPASGLYIRNAKNIELHDVELTFDKPDPKPPLVATDVDGLVLDGFKTPKPPEGETIRLEKVKRLTVRNSPGLNDTELAVAEDVKQ